MVLIGFPLSHTCIVYKGMPFVNWRPFFFKEIFEKEIVSDAFFFGGRKK